MEPEPDFQIRSCVDWRTEWPSSSEPRTSPAFSMLGSEWCLRLSCSAGALVRDSGHSLYLVPKDPVRTGDASFGVATYARHPTEDSRAPERRTWQEVTGRTRVVIWQTGHPLDDISATLIRGLEEVRFVCLFYGARPSKNGVPGNQCPGRTNEKSVQVSSEVPRDIESLSSDFCHLLEKEILPDVTLKCADRTFRAHRSVLGARSEVFRAMFQNETLESKTGAVAIADVDVDVLEKLLKFVYTGKPEDISEGNAADLYEAADQYAVLSLRSACAYWIERHLTVENCVKYLKVSDSHSDPDLKAAVVSFITGNPSVMKGESWIALSKELPVLANEVFQTYVASTVQ